MDTNEINSISKKLSTIITNICDDENKSLQERLDLLNDFKTTYRADLAKLIKMNFIIGKRIADKVGDGIDMLQSKMNEELLAEQDTEFDIQDENTDLNLDKDQLKNKQYINEIVPRLLGSDHRVGYIMLCIYSKLKTGISDHIKDIIEKLKNDQNSDFSYPPFYLDYPNNNINVNSLNYLFVYTHI